MKIRWHGNNPIQPDPPVDESRFDSGAWDVALDDDKPVEEMNESELIQYHKQCRELGVQAND